MTYNLLQDFHNCPDQFTAWLYISIAILIGIYIGIFVMLIGYSAHPENGTKQENDNIKNENNEK